jgi:hypothetical protein
MSQNPLRRILAVLTAAVMSVALLSGCGTSSTTTSTPTAAAGATTSATTPAAGASQSPSGTADASCPTTSTQSFAKTRFVVNVGLAAGAFHRYIYKPYQAGTFTKGANGRTMALVKAGLAGAFAAKQLKDATENVQADPALCKVFVKPMTELGDQLSTLKDKVAAGDVAALESAKKAIDSLKSLGAQHGMTITENENTKL